MSFCLYGHHGTLSVKVTKYREKRDATSPPEDAVLNLHRGICEADVWIGTEAEADTLILALVEIKAFLKGKPQEAA